MLWILLFISLSFNIAVVVSICGLGYKACPAPPETRSRPERLMLPPHLQDIPWDKDIHIMRSRFDSTKVELMKELAKDPIDEETVSEIIEQSLFLQGSLEKSLGDRLLKLRRQMTPEEANAYFEGSATHMQNRMQRIKEIRNRRQNNEKDNRN